MASYNISLKQVAGLFGFTARTTLKLVEAGLFTKPRVEKLNNKAFPYRFDKENLLQIKESFRTLEQLIQEYGVTESLVRNAIYRRKLKNYLTGICRKTFVKKCEFEEYMKRRKSQ
ncbi:hypothetical protein QNH39_18745 [Neobacillus novalis]|uniref:Uncharacterized protein n=1 Tax=Neobacillus novalis TaxID=220687 RepID=A0AA95MK80_9BACI|nr:hypothetical protein [Neobacillus novalis]WHY84677.1 hypothetical protein QNH39_18745 [Neobacillus novalis]